MKKIFLVLTLVLLTVNSVLASEQNISNKYQFKPYAKELNNEKLSSDIFEDKNIKIVRSKYELKHQTSEFADGYEYLITNKTNKPIVLKEMGSSSIFNKTEVNDKLNEIKLVDFVPVYSYYAWFRSIGEYSKFTKPFPFNYSIEPQSITRILILGRKDITPAVEFQFIIDDSVDTLIVDSKQNRFQDYSEKDYYKSQIHSYNVTTDAKGMIECINKKRINLVNAFSKSGIEVEKKISGQPPTYYALVKNQPEVMQLLLNSGANPNSTYLKNSLLYWAIIRNRPVMVKLLIDNGAKIDKKTIKYAKTSRNKHIKDLVLSNINTK